MSSVITRLRRTRPYLTPPFMSDEENGNDVQTILSAVRDARRAGGPVRLGGPSISGDESVVPVSELPISRQSLRYPDSLETYGAPMPPAQPEMALEPVTRNLPTEVLPSTNLSATDLYQSRRDMRPKIDPSIVDPQAQAMDYQRNLTNYQPQRESKKKIALRTALGFLFGGVPGAIGTLGNELMDRRQHDRGWQQNELARVGQMNQGLSEQRRAALQEELIRSQIGENQAQAGRVPQGPMGWVPNPIDVEGSDVYAPLKPGMTRAVRKPKPTTARPVTGKRVIGGITYQTEYDPESKKWTVSTGDDGQPVIIDEANPEKPAVDNKARAQGYYGLQKQAEGEAEKLRREAMGLGNVLDANGYPNADVQTRKEDLLRRANQADEKSRDFHAKAIEAETEPTATRSTGQYAGKPWSVSRWRANNPNATPEQEAAARAKASAAQMKVID